MMLQAAWRRGGGRQQTLTWDVSQHASLTQGPLCRVCINIWKARRVSARENTSVAIQSSHGHISISMVTHTDTLRAHRYTNSHTSFCLDYPSFISFFVMKIAAGVCVCVSTLLLFPFKSNQVLRCTWTTTQCYSSCSTKGGARRQRHAPRPGVWKAPHNTGSIFGNCSIL